MSGGSDSVDSTDKPWGIGRLERSKFLRRNFGDDRASYLLRTLLSRRPGHYQHGIANGYEVSQMVDAIQTERWINARFIRLEFSRT